ncbi:MAG TPA: hypothetical protein VL994_02645, partial [Steroidobacteraceae bacterium]|nr:hypothetical protein [Steroidobacteraceae bacterium]
VRAPAARGYARKGDGISRAGAELFRVPVARRRAHQGLGGAVASLVYSRMDADGALREARLAAPLPVA